jgi:hypothetical protein
MIMPSPSYAKQGLPKQSYASIGKRQRQGKLEQKKLPCLAVALEAAAL